MKDFRDAISFIPDNTGLLVDKSVEQLLLSAASIGVALVVAIPLGLWLGHIHRGAWLAINVSNIGRALPSLAVIAIGIGILGIGFANLMLALIVLAVPVLLTNTYVAIDGVDRDAVEAARGMGMSELQVLTRVELPLGLPLIFAGIRTSAVQVVASATLATFIGGGGLGDLIVLGFQRNDLAVQVGGSLAVAILAIITEVSFGFLERGITPKGLLVAQERRNK